MSLAKKRKHVVLTQAVHLDVLDQDHFVIGLVKQRGAQDVRGFTLMPLVRTAMALAARIGAFNKPSRRGSSPQMVRTFSYASAIAFTAASS